MKRIIVCCDGTWVDALYTKNAALYTNIARIDRCLAHVDARASTKPSSAIEQVKLYLRGVGTATSLTTGTMAAVLGKGILEDVREAYAFIADNWEPGDEVWLFGFSRGSYTAKMTATLMSEFGILQDMTMFPTLMDVLLRMASKSSYSAEQRQLDLRIWNTHLAAKKAQDAALSKLRPDGVAYNVAGLCLFDLVTSEGRPQALRPKRGKDHSLVHDLLGLPQHALPHNVERCYQAMALDEEREDYQVIVLEKSLAAPASQVLEQVWFSGSHADIGGGWEDGDLSCITLWWMVDRIDPYLAFDLDKVRQMTLVQCNAPYGQLQPHDTRRALFKLTEPFLRPMPNHLERGKVEEATCERLHSPELSTSLGALEKDFAQRWDELAHRLGVTEADAVKKRKAVGIIKHTREKMESAGVTVFNRL